MIDKQAATKIIRETFEKPFDKGRFAYFAKNLLNKIDESKVLHLQGAYIPESFREYVKTYERLGTYTDPEGQKLDILIVYLQKETSLERARTAQRNFVARYLKERGEKEAGLVAFVSPEPEDWRFSFVKMEYRLEETPQGKVKAKEELTPARRLSFLVGENESSHTAQKQLFPILEDDKRNPSLSVLEKAFSVEVVTKEFFGKYRELFLDVKEALDKLVEKDEVIRKDFTAKKVSTVDFSKKLLGQIVFLYFLQKKGWFGVARDAEWGTGSKQFLRELFEGKHGTYKNFFNDILEPLFYEALRIDRSHDDDYYSRFDCKIPFLNGGLFDPINNYDWVHTDIILPNGLFSNSEKTKEGDTGTGILDVFDRYNFTVWEDEPLEKEVAIDPEMLGKVFENLLEVKDRKSKGTYYTPREIVHYMCQESLINYLDTAVNTGEVPLSKTKPSQGKLIGEPDPEQMSLKTTAYKPIVPRQDIEDFVRKGELAIEHDSRVETFGRETKTYSYRISESIRSIARIIDDKLGTIRVCDPAVGSGAFLVGMMHEIVKCRKVLTTYLGGERGRSVYDFKRHAIQSCLYGVDIDPGAVEIAKLRLWLSLVVDEEDIRQIKPLPNLDYKIVCGNSLLGVEKTLFNLDLFKELEILKPLYFDETNAKKKQECKGHIDQLIKQITNNNENFDFQVYFSEVFHEKGGFDVVMANPPYIRQEQIKEYKQELQKLYSCYTGVADIFVYFYERGFQILKECGTLTFISSNKYFRSGYGEKLRQFLGSKATVCQLIDFGDAPVFDAISYPSIIILSKSHPKENQVRALTWEPGAPIEQFAEVFHVNSFLILQKELTADGWRLESPAVFRLLEKLRRAGKPLGEYVNGRFYRGILTGLNEAFVVDRATRDRLIAEHPSSAEILKTFLRGRDVKRWRVDFAEQYLIKIESSENRRHPWSGKTEKEAEKTFAKACPAIHAHLSKFQERLIERDDQGKYFWELRSCVYWQEFEQPKIAYPNICKRNEFAWDDSSYYTNQKAFIIPRTSKYLLGVLNSSVVMWLFEKVLAKLQNDFFEPSSIFIKDFPIPVIENHKSVESLVDRILVITKDSDYLSNQAKQSRVKELEREIDQLVYHLYGLTPEEIAVVEGSIRDKA